jgi:hypothetical protein
VDFSLKWRFVVGKNRNVAFTGGYIVKRTVSILLALVLALSLNLVMAVPVFAAATGHIVDNNLGAQVVGVAQQICVQKATITNPGGGGSLDIDCFAVTNAGGTAVDADVSQVAVYNDTNGTPGSWDGGDALIGSAANFTAATAIGLNNEAACLSVAAGATEVVFVVVTTAAAPTDGSTFITTIDGTDLLLASVDSWDGGGSAATATSATTIDAVLPTVTAVTPANLADADVGVVTVDIDFSEAMDAATIPTVNISGLASSPYNLVSAGWADADTWQGTFTLNDDNEEAIGTYNISGAKDACGNTMAADSANTVNVDTMNPTVAITSAVSPGPTNSSPIPMTATFSENVTGFVVGDIVVANGNTSNFVAVSGTVYTFDVTPLAQGLVVVNIAAAVAQDAVGNPNTAAPQFVIGYVSGGGGYGSGPASGSGSMSLTPYLDGQGKTIADLTLTSTDGLVTMGIHWGTQMLDAQGTPLESIEINILSTPPPPPGYALVGHAYDCLPAGATFQPDILLTFHYRSADIPGGVSEQDLVLAYWDGGKWVNLPTTVNAANNTAAVRVEHFTAFAILAYTAAPTFGSSGLSITPPEVDVGEEVNISLLVTNTGGYAGGYEVTLEVDSVAVATKAVALDAGASERVTFNTAKDAAGTYTVSVGGLSGTFEVKQAASPPEATPPPASEPPLETAPPAGGEAQPLSTWLIVGIIAAVVVVVLVAVMLGRGRGRRRA